MNIKNIITDFFYDLGYVKQLFLNKFGNTNYIYLKNSNSVTKNGFLTTNIRYSFHGLGCEVYLKKYSIDLEFDDNGMIIGFTIWNLYKYYQQRIELYKELNIKSLSDLKKMIDMLLIEGYLQKHLGAIEAREPIFVIKNASWNKV
jgi:hypothetical protein